MCSPIIIHHLSGVCASECTIVTDSPQTLHTKMSRPPETHLGEATGRVAQRSPWTMHHSKKSNRPYSETRVSTYIRPSDFTVNEGQKNDPTVLLEQDRAEQGNGNNRPSVFDRLSNVSDENMSINPLQENRHEPKAVHQLRKVKAMIDPMPYHPRNGATKTDVVIGMDVLFSKRYTFSPSGYDSDTPPYVLPAPQHLYPKIKASPDAEMMTYKRRLNDVRSRLDDKDIAVWRRHTKLMLQTGDIAQMVKRQIGAEMGTKAFCKLFEILVEFQLAPFGPQVSTVHLCEAPGAFVAATNHYLRQVRLPFDVKVWTSFSEHVGRIGALCNVVLIASTVVITGIQGQPAMEMESCDIKSLLRG